MNKIKVFISYSQKDIEFAQQMHNSLLFNHIETFIDIKNILIGDSIPEKIYAGIDESTHLIYIMSKNSAVSPWVKEELSIAKVREKQAKGFKILPILLDDVEIPAGLAHVRYADFRNWKNPYSYRHSFLLLLEALNIKQQLLVSADFFWYSKYSSEIQEHYLLYSEIHQRLFGELDMAQALGIQHEFVNNGSKWFRVLKDVFREDNILRPKLKYFYEQILSDIDEHGDGKLAALKKKIKAIIVVCETEHVLKSYIEASNLVVLLRDVAQIIQEIRTEVEITLLASIPTS